jgi:hypothetical protein
MRLGKARPAENMLFIFNAKFSAWPAAARKAGVAALL